MFGRLAEVYDSTSVTEEYALTLSCTTCRRSFDAVGRYVACLHSPVCPVDTDRKVLSLFLLH